MRLPSLILAAALGLAPLPGAAQHGAGLPAITVATVERAPLVERVRASGMIGPVERVLVQPQIEGQAIEAIEAEVGDRVAAGAVLARLSDAALQLQRSQLEASLASAGATIAQAEAQVLEAEAVRDEALRTRDRAVRLAEQGATTAAAADTQRANAATAAARVTAAGQALEAARAQERLVEAQIDDVELQLRRTAVTAPVAGEVAERTATIGAIASMAGEPLFVLIRDGALELRADVAEADLLALEPGQSARLRIVGSSAPITGRVRLVEPTVDATSRLGRVRIAIDDPARVRWGMFAEAEIEVRSAVAPAVPLSAVAGGADGPHVLAVAADGVIRRVPVVTGMRDGGQIEIIEGLSEGDRVVAKAGAFVRDGDRINPVPAETAAASAN